MAARGRCHTRNINISHNKLLSQSTYMAAIEQKKLHTKWVSIHPSIFVHLSGARSRGQLTEQGVGDTALIKRSLITGDSFYTRRSGTTSIVWFTEIGWRELFQTSNCTGLTWQLEYQFQINLFNLNILKQWILCTYPSILHIKIKFQTKQMIIYVYWLNNLG